MGGDEERTRSFRRATDADGYRRRSLGRTPTFGVSRLGSPIKFVIPGTGDAYPDLAKTYLLIRAKVIRVVGTDIAADKPVAHVNNWLHSLFSQVDVYLNDTLVTPSSNTYQFRADVDTLLSYGGEAKNTRLTRQLWYKDTVGHMGATTVGGGNNNNNNTGYLLHAISPKSKEHIACYKHYNKLQIHCCQKHCCETLLQLQNIDKTFHPLIQQYSS